MKKIVFLFVLLLPFNSFSQKREVVILDSITLDAIPYSSIQYENSNIGLFADEFGKAVIDNKASKLMVKSLGYFDKIVDLKITENKIYLKPKVTNLDEVILYNYGKEELLENQKAKFYVGFKTNTNGLIFARKFKDLNDLSLRKVFLSIENDSVPKKVFLEIYDIGEDGKPEKNILQEKIVVDLSSNQNGLEIDLTEEAIVLSQESYYVALTILNFKESNSKVKLGFRQSRDNLTFFKPYFKKKQSWGIIPNYKEDRYLNLNISIAVAKIL